MGAIAWDNYNRRSDMAHDTEVATSSRTKYLPSIYNNQRPITRGKQYPVHQPEYWRKAPQSVY